MEENSNISIGNRWSKEWQNQTFKKQFIIGIVLLVILLAAFPIFFNAIETRNGYQLNDWLLRQLPSINLSIPIFSLIWVSAIITITQAVKYPRIFLLFLWGFIFLSFSRMITIGVFPLNPPNDLVPLVDPINNTFYGGKFITKDLFYSGHTSSIFLMYLCLQKPWHKRVTLAATILVGAMVLVQHVHYTIDVVAAFPFTYVVYLGTKKFIEKTSSTKYF